MASSPTKAAPWVFRCADCEKLLNANGVYLRREMKRHVRNGCLNGLVEVNVDA